MFIHKGKKMLAMLTLIPLATGMVMGAFPAAITYADAGDNTPINSQATGSWQTGDLHVHTFESDDAQVSLEDVLDAGLTKYGLDWIALTDHLRLSKRDHNGNDISDGPIPMSQGMNEYQVPQIKALQDAGKYTGKTIFSGFEWDMPTHEHVGVGILTDEPNSTEALNAAKEFEYRFTNRAANLFNAADVANWDQNGGRAYTTHQDALTAINWLATNYPMTSYAMINHPSRGKNKYTIADFRDFNDLAPQVVFGIEGMLGNQMEPDRGGYNTSYNVANPTADDGYKYRTYGGVDYMVAKVGGLWDALLGEGRHFWNYGNSDYHFKTIGTNSSGYFPGEYAKTYSWVEGTGMQAVLDGLRSGKSFSVFGDLINALDFTASGAGNQVEMGEDLNVTQGDEVELKIRFKSPATSNNYENPINNGASAGQVPVVDHVDLIAGDVTAKAEKGTAAYTKDTNDSTQVLATFTSNDWTTDAEGYNVITYKIQAADQDKYFRLRGTNLGMNVTGETVNGEPQLDPKNTTADATTRFNQINESNYRDLWFYSNPIFMSATPYSDAQAVTDTIQAIDLGDLSAVHSDLTLPVEGKHGATISWSSSNPERMNNEGKLLTQPDNNERLELTATVQRGTESQNKTFTVIVEGTNNQALVLKSNMTTADGQPYYTDTWTNQSVTVSVTGAVYAPATSAIIELSRDGGQTYEPYTGNTPLEITEPGEHNLLFRATDDLEQTYTLPLVIKMDREIPVISLQGSSQMTLNVGDTYNEPGAQASDNVGIRGSVHVDGTVNTQAAGIYTLRYNVKDIAGNAAQEVIRTVTVQARSGNSGGGSGGGNGGNSGGNSGGSTPSVPTTPIVPTSPTNPETGSDSSTEVKVEVEANQPVQAGLKDIVQFNAPAGAIGSKDTLQVSLVAKDKLQKTASLNVLGQAVQISRSGGRTLNDQAVLSLKVDSTELPNGTQPAIYYYNEARQSWVFIGGKTNAAGNITTNVNHLGTFVVSSYIPVNLPDLNGHWASDYADRLLGMNVIQGYTDGTFQPSKKITRAEFVTLLSKALALKSVESDTTFADQGNLPDWAKRDITAAMQAGIVKGYGDNTFKPDRTITRAEMAVMMANALKASSEAQAGMSGNTSVKPSFNDASQTPSWAQEALDAAVQAKIVSGYTDHTVRAGSETTRAEAVTMIYKLLLALHV
ncbi:S-layer homology domain-containing protein [Paenibacillus sp. FSL R5-0713]|uniref:S-layer homology domain-containing protein n=1 Tax=Paenibacillus sp. FSL R5-0713 TaxID=2921655 RepID=UPI0030DC162A